MQHKYSDREIKEILDKAVILIDTREKDNENIIEYLKKNKRPYKIGKLRFGDYSIMIPKDSFKGQLRDIYFTDDVVVEKKKSIDEIAMNFKDKIINIKEVTKEIIDLLGKEYLEKILKQDYNRLKMEFTNLNKNGTNFFILMEDEEFDMNIRMGNYRSLYNKKVLYERIKALEAEFKTLIRPTRRECMGSEVYHTLRYFVRDKLKNEGYMEEDVNESNIYL